MSEKKVRFAKYDPKIMFNLTKVILGLLYILNNLFSFYVNLFQFLKPTQTSYVQSNQYCDNCGHYQFDTDDMR